MLKSAIFTLTSMGVILSSSPSFARLPDAPEEKPSLSSTQEKREERALEFQAFTGKINGNNVRMRLQPHLDGHIIQELSKGDLLLITGEQEGFYSVVPPRDIKAYIFRTYVLEDVVEGSNVNVRLQPHRDGLIIAQLHTGDKAEGIVSPLNSKWIEMPPPESTRFFIAKEYVHYAGDANFITQIENKRNEAHHLLNSSYLLAQAEMRKPFEEIDIQRIAESFEKIISEYREFPKYTDKAKEVLELVQDTYLQKKIAFLESKTQSSSEKWAWQNSKLAQQIKEYEDRLAQFEDELEQSAPPTSSKVMREVITNREEGLQKESPKKGNLSRRTEAVESIDEVHMELTKKKPQENFSRIEDMNREANDKMLLWEPVEKARFHQWAVKHPQGTVQDFYLEEKLNSVKISGIVEPYNRPVKNKPGDYVLRVDNKTVAYLYSTKVNLQEKIGQHLDLTASPRDNNHFAFPAYHVLSAE